jgi:hypothetical protein
MRFVAKTAAKSTASRGSTARGTWERESYGLLENAMSEKRKTDG